MKIQWLIFSLHQIPLPHRKFHWKCSNTFTFTIWRMNFSPTKRRRHHFSIKNNRIGHHTIIAHNNISSEMYRNSEFHTTLAEGSSRCKRFHDIPDFHHCIFIKWIHGPFSPAPLRPVYSQHHEEVWAQKANGSLDPSTSLLSLSLCVSASVGCKLLKWWSPVPLLLQKDLGKWLLYNSMQYNQISNNIYIYIHV